ncbi:glycoside hydrolase superfamily [Chytridium lagenaria]|nr:glycoside hydrolase superfamily [Chytridium lagenaria]
MVNVIIAAAVFAVGASAVIAAPTDDPNHRLYARSPSSWNLNDQMTWDQAVKRAKELVATLSLNEKVDLASGTGWAKGPCVGNIKAVPKIGFKGLCLQDSPAGIRYAFDVSAFPASINVAATFDKTLMYKNGFLMGEEARNKGIHVLLAPVANMLRAPAGGRNWEGQGADPYLTGLSTANQVRGIQDMGVQATIKHFIGNEQEHFRDGGNSIIDKRTLQEIYVRPFKHAIQAGAVSVMCSYNRINATYACESPQVMSLLKDQLKFQGFVMSDWWATHSTNEAANSGLDMVMPGSISWGQTEEFWWGQNLINSVNGGKVAQSRVDDMAVRILTPWIKLGQDKDFPATNFDSFNPRSLPPVNVQANHKQHIREVGAASSILLKNYPKIAVIGSDAFAPREVPTGDKNENPTGTLAQGWGSGTSNFPYIVAPIEGMAGPAKNQRVEISGLNENWDTERIKRTAAAADLSVVFVNSNSENNAGDHSCGCSQPGAVDMPWIDHPNVVAVIYALFPGQETGNAIADVLFGLVNPSGRLPFSVMKDRKDYSADVNYNNDQISYNEGIFVDYRGNEKRNVNPVFPFGHGLSYTSFSYSNLEFCTASRRAVSTPTTRLLTVTVTITNTGEVVGSEVPQLYIGFPSGVDQPPKQLRGFEKVRIEPGRTIDVGFVIQREDVEIWDVVKNDWVVPQGTYTAFVGSSSRDVKLQGTFTI